MAPSPVEPREVPRRSSGSVPGADTCPLIALELESSITKDAIEIDRGRLYFARLPKGASPPSENVGVSDNAEALFFGTDAYVYQHFFADFGPLHLGHVYAFCVKLDQLLEQPGGQQGRSRKPVYVYSGDHPHRRSNAAVLVLIYAVRPPD